jgi:hypothetical protein
MLRILFIASVVLSVILFSLKAAAIPSMLAWSWLACFAPIAAVLLLAVAYAMIAAAVKMRADRKRWRR